MFLSRFFTGLGTIFIFLGLIFLYQRNNPNRLSFVSPPPYEKTINKLDSQPIRLLIKKYNIDLPILPAKIEKKQWQTTTKGASWLISSPIPGDKGNSIIYGHNWTNLMGPLVKIKPGELVKIKYKNNTTKTFVINATTEVGAKDFNILQQSSDKRITLYTCSGLFDQNRFVAIANLLVK